MLRNSPLESITKLEEEGGLIFNPPPSSNPKPKSSLKRNEAKTLKFRLGGVLETADKAFKKMTKPRDVFFLDMNHKTQARILTEEQIDKLQN